MSSITIDDLDEALQQRLQERAIRNHRSLAEEIRGVLKLALAMEENKSAANLAERIRMRMEPLGGVDLPRMSRSPLPNPITFDQ